MSFLLKLLIHLIYYLELFRFGKGLRRLIYFVLAHIVRYRRKVVDANLTILLPHASKLELSAYKSRYYHHMADLIVETLWCFRASPEEL